MGLILGCGNRKWQKNYDELWYGVQGDTTSSDYLLKRAGNQDLHRTLPIQNRLRRFVENEDGSVKYYLHQNDSRLKASGEAAVIDSSDGNVMLEKPEYYFRLEIDGTKWIRAYSEHPLPGFVKMERKTIAPWFSTVDIEKSTAVSGCFLKWNGDEVARNDSGLFVCTPNAANFRGGNGSADASLDGTYKQQLGMGRTFVNKATVRPWCKNGTHIGAYRCYNEIAWLQRVEYASLHCQDTYNPSIYGLRYGGLGNGCTADSNQWNTWGAYRPFIPGGVTCTLGNNTGKVSFVVKNWNGADKAFQVTSYRGLEVPFEYLWMLADDVLVWYKPDETIAYVCEDPTKFTSWSDNAATEPDYYNAVATLPRSSGNIRILSHTSNGYSFPKTIGTGGASDYFYTQSSGWFGALLSAGASNGANAGIGYLHAGNRSSYSYANIGFRLCRF